VVLEVKNTLNFEKWYHVVVWGVAFLVSLIPFTGGPTIYGPAGGWYEFQSSSSILGVGFPPISRIGVWEFGMDLCLCSSPLSSQCTH
jgi:hypothetical protein